MPYADSRQGGLRLAFPNVLEVDGSAGPVARALPNQTALASAIPSQDRTLMTAAPALNLGSVIPVSTGDTMARQGGGPARPHEGSAAVLIGGLPATAYGHGAGHNGWSSTAAGSGTLPSQSKVQILR